MKSNARNKSAKSAKGKGNPSFRTAATFRARQVYQDCRVMPAIYQKKNPVN